jgi:lysophospholipase L1-like esterase
MTTLKVLERLLNEGSPSVHYEVINFAVPGYNTVMEVETLKEKGLAYDPDAVIVLFCGNDLNVPAFLQERPNLLSFGHSYLLEWIAAATAGGERSALKTLYEIQLVQPRDFFTHRELLNLEPDPKHVPPAYRHLVGLESYTKALEELQRLSRRYGFPVLMTFTWGDLEYWLKAENPDAAIAQHLADWPFYHINRRFGFYIVDTLQDQLAYLRRHGLHSQAFRVSENDPHPNAAQHHLIAWALYRTLVEKNLIPDAAQRIPRLSEQLEKLQASIAPATESSQ